jgi:hypothetical protein
VSSFDHLLRSWALAACAEWRYEPPAENWYAAVRARLPEGVRDLVARAVAGGEIRLVDGYKFKLATLAASQGPYAFLGRDQRGVPAPHWEYFVQAAEYERVRSIFAPHGYVVGFEDRLMDITVSTSGGRLEWYIEVKEQGDEVVPLLTGVEHYGRNGVDLDAPDRGNDPLRKAKCIVLHRPRHFSIVAIGTRVDRSVAYAGDIEFSLIADMIALP